MAQPAPSLSPEAAFAALPLFGGVPPEVCASFAHQGRLHRYRAGTIMFLQGDPPDAVYCVLSGRVEITTTAADGRVRILAMVAPGELLGELAVLGAMGRSGSAICVTDTTAWAVDGQQFLRFLTAHPPVALALLSSLSRLVITQNGLVETCSSLISRVGWRNGCLSWQPRPGMPHRAMAPSWTGVCPKPTSPISAAAPEPTSAVSCPNLAVED
jgi:hypothetical protein